MERRRFTREVKLEAVKLCSGETMSDAQAARNWRIVDRIMRFLAFVAFWYAILGLCGAWSADLSGPARVIDGDTIVLGAQHVRLFGIGARGQADL